MDLNKKFPFQSDFKIQSFGIKLKESEKKDKEDSKETDKDKVDDSGEKFPKKSKINTEPEVTLGITQI